MATDLEKQSKLINDMLTETENTFKELDREMNMLKEEQYLKSQELFNVRKSEANLLAEISGAQAQNKNMLAKVNQLDQETFKQQVWSCQRVFLLCANFTMDKIYVFRMLLITVRCQICLSCAR